MKNKLLPTGIKAKPSTGAYCVYWNNKKHCEVDTLEEAKAVRLRLKRESKKGKIKSLGGGVYQNYNQFAVRFTVSNNNRKSTEFLGMFDTEEEARLVALIYRAKRELNKRISKPEKPATPIPTPTPKPEPTTPDLSTDKAYYDKTLGCFCAIAKSKLYKNLKSAEEARGIVRRGKPFA